MNNDFSWIGPPVQPAQIEIIENALAGAVEGKYNSSFLQVHETIFARMNDSIIHFMFINIE